MSERIEKIANMVTACDTVADIGCDHCHTLIYLVKNKIARTGIGCDINKGPLERGLINIQKEKLDNLITLRLSNGFEKLEYNEVQAVVISGMGGLLINDILVKDIEKTKTFKQIILSPQHDIPCVRRNIHKLGFSIDDEIMIEEDGKYYTIIKAIIKAIDGERVYENEIFYEYGKLPLQRKCSVLRKFLSCELEKYNKVMEKHSSEKIIDKINNVKEAISWF